MLNLHIIFKKCLVNLANLLKITYNYLEIVGENRMDKIGLKKAKEYIKKLNNCQINERGLALFNKPSQVQERTKAARKELIEQKWSDYTREKNQSWFYQMKKVLEEDLNRICAFYRGRNISGRELIENIEKTITYVYKVLGIRQGDEIAICMSNTPEYLYIKCALNAIGAICNSFVSAYSTEMLESIITSTSCKAIFMTDKDYILLKNIIPCGRKIVLNSLADSLTSECCPPKEYSNEMRKKLNKYYSYQSSVEQLKKENSNITPFSKLLDLEIDKDLIKKIYDRNASFEEVSSVTYTSGSTALNPKAMFHDNGSVIISSIRHKPEIAKTASMKGLKSLFNIHVDSNTGNITQMLDIIFQGGIVAFEPEYSLETFLDVLYINQPNIAASTTSLYIAAAKMGKKYYREGIYEPMKWLLVPCAVGEGLMVNEEKLLNSFLHFFKAGKGFKLGNYTIPIPITMSVGGGDCERGGIFFTMFRSFKNLLNINNQDKVKYSLESYSDVIVAVLDPDTLEEKDYDQNGIIVTSPTHGTFKGYKGNDEETLKTQITDDYGRTWCFMHTDGKININYTVIIHGWYVQIYTSEENVKYSAYLINETISNLNRIFSVTTIEYNQEFLIINYIPCKTKMDRNRKVLKMTSSLEKEIEEDIRNVLIQKFGNSILSKVRIRRIKGDFPVTGSCKRSVQKIKELGIEGTKQLIEDEAKLRKRR